MKIKRRISDNAINGCIAATSMGPSAITALLANSLHNDPIAILSYAVIVISLIFIILSLVNHNPDCNTINYCPHRPIYDDQSLTALLGITDEDLKYIRDNGLLGYSHFDDKYWYTQSDIDRFLSHCHYAPFAENRD